MSECQRVRQWRGPDMRAGFKCQRLGTGVLIVCLAMLVTKCGGSSKPTDARQRVADVVKRFENAAINRDGTTYCALLTDTERSYVLKRSLRASAQQAPVQPRCEQRSVCS
jgi:hypothetical protein